MINKIAKSFYLYGNKIFTYLKLKVSSIFLVYIWDNYTRDLHNDTETFKTIFNDTYNNFISVNNRKLF